MEVYDVAYRYLVPRKVQDKSQKKHRFFKRGGVVVGGEGGNKCPLSSGKSQDKKLILKFPGFLSR